MKIKFKKKIRLKIEKSEKKEETINKQQSFKYDLVRKKNIVLMNIKPSHNLIRPNPIKQINTNFLDSKNKNYCPFFI